MKNPIIRYLFPVIILLFGFSCENNEAQPTETANPTENETENECIESGVKGKLIEQWCVSSQGVVNILSDINLGVEYTSWGGAVGESLKKYENAVIAQFDSVALKNGKGLNEILESEDSIFYFTYDLKPAYFQCEPCCPPSKTIFVTSFSSNSCAY